MINKSLAVGIVFLFIVSTVTPLVIGYNIEITNREFMDDLTFDCYDKYGSSKASYYMEYLLRNPSDDYLESDSFDFSEKTEITKTNNIQTIKSKVVSVGPMDSPWPMKCHDTHHTGLSPYSTVDNNGEEEWKFLTVDGAIDGGPIIGDDGTIYFGAKNRYLYALYPNGTLRWKYKTNGWIWSTPAIAKDGTIYFGTYGDKLYAINSDGTWKWDFYVNAAISTSPAIAEDGTIYFGTMGFPEWEGCKIFAVNPDGTEKWHYDTGYKIVSDPAIGDDGTIYIGSADTYFYALRSDGTLRWRFKTNDWIKAHPSIADDGTIYISSFDEYLYALYPNGTLKWKYGDCYGGCSSASIDKEGIIYVAGINKLLAIYPDGTNKWGFDLGNMNIGHSSPAISNDGTIYVGADKYIVAINSDGTEKWRKRIAENWVESSPCIDKDGTVYIGSHSTDDSGYPYGYLYAFGSGELKAYADGPYYGLINEPVQFNGDASGGHTIFMVLGLWE